MKKLLLISALLLVASNGWAEARGDGWIKGFLIAKCSAVTLGLEKSYDLKNDSIKMLVEDVVLSSIISFMSGMNFAAPEGLARDISFNSDEYVLAFFKNSCEKNPDEMAIIVVLDYYSKLPLLESD